MGGILLASVGNSYGVPPENISAPVLSGFEFATQTLSVANGTWEGDDPITFSYQWYKDGAVISGETSSTYTTIAADEGSIFYCEVTATNNAGEASQDSNSTGALGPVAGQQLFTQTGTSSSAQSYSWVAPAGVTSVSVVAVGGGGLGHTNSGKGTGGGGGGLGWRNNVSVTPGNSYTVTLGETNLFENGSNDGEDGGDAEVPFANVYGNRGKGGSPFTTGGEGGFFTGQGGGRGGEGGGNTSNAAGAGGGGAGGYSGNGGNGSDHSTNTATNGSGGGGGGGGFSSFNGNYLGGGGGGVGLFGEGPSGAAGVQSTGNANGGSGGSGGSGGLGQPYGGAFGGGGSNSNSNTGAGGAAVRILWPGDIRQFPTTDVENF